MEEEDKVPLTEWLEGFSNALGVFVMKTVF